MDGAIDRGQYGVQGLTKPVKGALRCGSTTYLKRLQGLVLYVSTE